MTEFQAKLIIWGLIIILFLIANRIARWSREKQEKAFNKAVEDAVKKELDKREAATKVQNPRPGSDAHYEAWRAEKLAEQKKEP